MTKQKQTQIIEYEGKKYKVIEILEEPLILGDIEIRIIDDGVKRNYEELLKIIPKGFRLLKIQEVIDLCNSNKIDYLIEKYKQDWRLFFFEQPFNKNKKLKRVAGLGSDGFDYRLFVGAYYSVDDDDGFSFGVFCKELK